MAPPHVAAVKNAALQNPAFLPAVRTLRLWADSHLLSGALPAMLGEMIMMAVMTPSTAVLNPAVAFVRALQLIATFAWHSDVLFVDPTGSFTESEKRGILHEIEIVRSQPSEKRAVFAVAPYDRNSLATAETPDKPSWAHVQIVAQRTLRKLQAATRRRDDPLVLQDFAERNSLCGVFFEHALHETQRDGADGAPFLGGEIDRSVSIA